MTAESSAITNSQPVSVCPAVSVWLGLMVLVVECPFFPGTPGAELGLLGDQAPASGQMAISLILALWALWGGCPRQDHPPNTHTHTHTHTHTWLATPLVVLVGGSRLSMFPGAQGAGLPEGWHCQGQDLSLWVLC